MTAPTSQPTIAQEAAELIAAAGRYSRPGRLTAIRKATQGVRESGQLGNRSPERCRLLLDELARAAERTEG